MKISSLPIFMFSILFFLLSGCQSSEQGSSDSSSTGEISTPISSSFATIALSGNFTSYKSQTQATQGEKSSRSFSANQLMTGQLSITDTNTSVETVENWSIYLDEETWAVQSNKTIILSPGNYDFALLVNSEDGTQQYVGTANGSIADGTNDIALTIRPVIGDTVTNVTIASNLADFKFQYPVSELVGLSNPKIGIQIDDATEDIFDISTDSGKSEAYINIAEGSRKIILKLYDGNTQKGKSIQAQENQTVVAGQGITMDLIPLHGETTFSLTEEGGEGNFSFSIPKDIVEEVGGTNNLEALFSLSGNKNSLQEVLLTLEASGDHYKASTKLQDLQFDVVTLSLQFSDLGQNPKELLGGCTQDTTLDVDLRNLSCNINLRRRAILGGHYFGVLGVNVFNQEGAPIQGATLSANDGSNDSALGLTGSGDFGTIGYLKSYLTQGNYTIRAEQGGLFGTASVSLNAGGIENVSIVLDQNVVSTNKVTSLSLGEHHSCALWNNGSIKCWGYNHFGKLGIGDANARGDEENEMGSNLPFVDLGTGVVAVELAAGGKHNCARLSDNTVKCWGRNDFGLLGIEDPNHRGDNDNEMGDALPTVDFGTGRTAVSIEAGFNHTCAILDNGSVKCWGLNTSGQLGQGNLTTRGGAVGDMGDNLVAVNLGTGRTATQVISGNVHSCALLDNGSVKCWGNNESGQLGQGDEINRGGDPADLGDNLNPVDFGAGRTAVQIRAGTYYTCALLDNNSVKCWGSNALGQLGVGDTDDRGDGPGEMGDSLSAVDLGAAGKTITDLQTGAFHACVLFDDKSTKCWGYNHYGQLGLEDRDWRGNDNSNEMGDNLPAINLGTGKKVEMIRAGESHTCAILDDETIKCWGRNDSGFGQLGQEDITWRGYLTGDMGDALPTVALE